MLDFVREGDTIYIYNLSRLARNVKDLLEIVERLNAKGVGLVSDKEAIDTQSITGKLLLTIVSAVNEFMIDNQRESQLVPRRPPFQTPGSTHRSPPGSRRPAPTPRPGRAPPGSCPYPR